MDRDGVINEEVGLITKPEELKLIPGSARAISMLNNLSIPVIIVTNQPVIGRGLCSVEELNKVHEHLFNLLSEHSAHVDGLYYCPHHPVHGVGEYKLACSCRKPSPGLLFKASKVHNIDLSKSYMVGDRTSDIKAGNLAGCTTIGVKTGYGCDDGFKDAIPDIVAQNLKHAVGIIIERRLK